MVRPGTTGAACTPGAARGRGKREPSVERKGGGRGPEEGRTRLLRPPARQRRAEPILA